ncbi:MAG: glycoside hydrolase, partial [Bacteroidales bacterium]|nr:glycoside hydrolase [Bacteroidales bacterium]
MKKAKFLFLAIMAFVAAGCGQTDGVKDYLITDFGGVGDGKFLNSRTIQSAIDYISENGGGRLVFPAGDYVSGTFYLKSDVTLHLEEGATILGSTNP